MDQQAGWSIPNPVTATNDAINRLQDSINTWMQSLQDSAFRGLKWSGWNIAAALIVGLGIWLLIEG